MGIVGIGYWLALSGAAVRMNASHQPEYKPR